MPVLKYGWPAAVALIAGILLATWVAPATLAGQAFLAGVAALAVWVVVLAVRALWKALVGGTSED